MAGADGNDSGLRRGRDRARQRPRRATPAAPREREGRRPRRCRSPSSLTGILFDSGATYYASLAGVSRWQEGQLRTWSENEGLASELVHAIGRGSDGAIWAATSEGLARFDGQNWRPLGTTELAARGLATDGKGRLWIATSKGLRRAARGRGRRRRLGRAPVVLAGEMRDVAADRFGRIWAMSTTSIALVDRTNVTTVRPAEGPFSGPRDTVSRVTANDESLKGTRRSPTSSRCLPIRDLVVFPYMIVPLRVTRPVSMEAVAKALESDDRLCFLVAQRDSDRRRSDARSSSTAPAPSG